MPIEVNELCYSYKKGTPFEKQVLFEISLTIKEGESIGLIGPTQSGKTTLAQHLNALIIPQRGKVIINGCNTAARNADLISLRQKVGYIFQNPDYQLFAPTVGEDIAFGPKNQGLAKDEVSARVRNAMSQVGLDYTTFVNRDIYALSGGQKRRAAIAGVLACLPEILILDDVTAGLDPKGREEMIALIRDLHSRQGITIIFISNSMDEVAKLAERIIVLKEGRIFLDGLTRHIFSEAAALKEIGLELPEVMKLTTQLSAKGFNLPPALLTIDEAAQSIYKLLHERQAGH